MTTETNLNTSYYIQQVFLLFCPPLSAHTRLGSYCRRRCRHAALLQKLNELLTHNLFRAPQHKSDASICFPFTVIYCIYATRLHPTAAQLHVDGAACSLLWLWDNFSRRSDWNTARNFLFTGETSLKTLQQEKKKKLGFERDYIIIVLPCVCVCVCVCFFFFLIFSYPRP